MRLFRPVVVLLVAASPALAQVPADQQFLVNTFTTNSQSFSRAAFDRVGRLTITWTSNLQDGASSGVYAQRYAEDGAPMGNEFLVPTITSSSEGFPDVAYGPAGNSVIVWHGASSSIRAQRYTSSGRPRGAEFVINTNTTGAGPPKVVSLPGGGFVVAWSGYTATDRRIVTRRFDAFGIPLGPDVQASGASPSASSPSLASAADGRFVVVWKETTLDRIAARLYDAAGAPVGPEFTVETAPAYGDTWPDVAMAGDGSFVVVWESNDGSGYGIRARMFSSAGSPVAAEFWANDGTAGWQGFPQVSAARLGDFVVSWSGIPVSPSDVLARRFSATGLPRSGDFAVNAYATGVPTVNDVVSDDVGNFVVSWSGAYDGYSSGVFARRFGGLRPAAAVVDPVSSPLSDGNGVLERGETVGFRPSWRNVNAVAQTFSGTIPSLSGPAGATYTIVDGAASYGTVAAGATAACTDCYSVSVTAPSRPAAHWDALAEEDIAPDTQGQRKQWRLHVGDSFTDVPRTSPFYRFVETLLHHSVTGGCASAQYCPSAPTTREQMAVFVVVARDAAGDPPPACGTPVFNDVPATSPFCRWIEELARAGVVAGCGGGNYCPSAPVSREQMAVFVLRTFEPALAPPACGTPVFTDVPASSPFCPWIEELARRGVVSGCGGGNYCPTAPITREQMAVFITATLGLRLYGP